ncbi:Flp family type IVb pilin [Acidaminococcus fermentans]|uniref:Flp family type IVb pilin n=1 Tax=Acidaminococcus fermentans TaxID=905 RepID=UPI003F88962D
MRQQKGQDIIEYALMLAIIVGIGGWIYNAGANGGLAGSINSVFNNASALLDEASKEKLPAASTAKDIIERLRQGRYDGLADVLQGKPSSTLVISSDSAAGQDLARKLNIQTKEGDGWFARVQTDGTTVFSYYSAAANNGVTFSQLAADNNSNPTKYYEASKGNNATVRITEGLFNSQGKSAVGSGKTVFENVKGFVGPSPSGSGFIIDPTRTNNLK